MIREVTYYQFVCDFPGCEVTAQEDGEFSAWGEESAALDDAARNDWLEDRDGERLYCRGHTEIRGTDRVPRAAELPEPPYLLFHDCDDDDCDVEPGTVTLIAKSGANS